MSRRARLNTLAATVLALGTGTVQAGENPFAVTDVAGGQLQLAGADRAPEGRCGEGKCGEGMCGGMAAEEPADVPAKGAAPAVTPAVPAPVPAVAGDKAQEGKCGEGKCGAAMDAP